MWRRLARRRRSRGRRSCWGRTGPAAPSSPARRGKGRTCGERPGRGGGRASVTAGPPALRGRLGSHAAGGSRGLRPGRGRAGTPLRRGRAVGRPRSGPADGSGERGAGSGQCRAAGRPAAEVRPRRWEGTASCGAGAALPAREPSGWGLAGCRACFQALLSGKQQ